MQHLQPSDYLLGQHKDSLKTETPLAGVEQVLQRGTQQPHHHHVALGLVAVVVELNETLLATELLDDAGLVDELRVLGLLLFLRSCQPYRFERMDLLGLHIVDQVHIAEGARTDAVAHQVLVEEQPAGQV